jgi:cell division protein FtsB
LVNSKYEVIAQRAATIQLLFEMKASGMGSETIARKLNGMPDAWHPKEHHLNKRGGWWPSYIEKIIRNRSVIGEFSSAKLSEPIMDYFPAVVPRDLFNRVQARIARNAAIPGHGASNMNGAINNIFGGVTRCARCGGTMAFVNKGQRRPTSVTPSQYLVCEKARRGLGCSKRTVRYDNLEGLLLRLCRGLNPADLLSNEAERSREVLRRQALEGELVQLDKRRNILMRLRGYVETEVSLGDLAAELDQIARRRAKLEREVADFSRDQSITAEAVAEHLQSVDDLITRMQQLKGAERSALRRRLRSALHSLIERLDINPSQHECKLTVTFRDGAALRLVLDERGALRLADDGTRLYWIDENGVVDVDPIADPSTEAEQLERQRRVNALVAKALKRQRVKDQVDL